MLGLSLPIAAALLAVYIFWGGAYLAMKFAIAYVNPVVAVFLGWALTMLWQRLLLSYRW